MERKVLALDECVDMHIQTYRLELLVGGGMISRTDVKCELLVLKLNLICLKE